MTNEQKLREALLTVSGIEDKEPCLACGSHHNLIDSDHDGDTSCYVREALSQPTSDEGTPTRRHCGACGLLNGIHTKDCHVAELERTLHAKERELNDAAESLQLADRSISELQRQLATLPSVSAAPQEETDMRKAADAWWDSPNDTNTSCRPEDEYAAITGFLAGWQMRSLPAAPQEGKADAIRPTSDNRCGACQREEHVECSGWCFCPCQSPSGWVPVSERLPELTGRDDSQVPGGAPATLYSDRVLVFDGTVRIDNLIQAEGNPETTTFYVGAGKPITHWMPLPKPPTGI